MNAPVRYAGFWLRFVAAVIDSILVSAIIVPLLMAAYGRGYFQPFLVFGASQDDFLSRLLGLAEALDQPMYSGSAHYVISYLLPAIAIVLFCIFTLALGRLAAPAFAGFMHGYLTYDLLHCVIHRGRVLTRA